MKRLSNEPHVETRVQEFINSNGKKHSKDREVVLEAMKNYGHLYQLAKNFKDDKEILMTALKSYLKVYSNQPLQYASDRLKNDDEIVLLALLKDPFALQYASGRLKNDDEIGLMLSKKNINALRNTSPRIQIKYSKEIVFENVTVLFLSYYTDAEKEKYARSIKKAISLVKASPIPNFKKTLNYLIQVGKSDVLLRYVGMNDFDALYDGETNNIYVNTDAPDTFRVMSVVHEFAHKFHYKHIKDSVHNENFVGFFYYATMPKTQCILANLPKLGSPLSNILNRGTFSWVLKTAYEDYYLKSIKGNEYFYYNKKGEMKKFTKQELIKYMQCPTGYSATNEFEWFAEMCTLITLNQVKPSQKLTVSRFIEMVREESL